MGSGVGMGTKSFTPNGGDVGVASNRTGDVAGESALDGGAEVGDELASGGEIVP
jgi:hypothetical protein